ncbi:hypothetical protein Pmani_003680 [Petrolisthes manimaculis]|uniref:Uncharacterized protein n=1 Tax=Petrolisthes manimaculis TaxID=1843537 RepID=A0AAE1QIB1_9EUCA|nr:hypothetical protein Pmani_003680 [Petrolisthes manimaculis]
MTKAAPFPPPTRILGRTHDTQSRLDEPETGGRIWTGADGREKRGKRVVEKPREGRWPAGKIPVDKGE